MSLFRDEVLAQKMTRLQGTVNLAIPMSWKLIGLALTIIVAVSAIFLSFAKYSRTETAFGFILPVGGILQIVPARPGQVENVFVREGQLVRKGHRLAWVRIEESDQSGVGKQTAILSAIDQQRQGLRDQQALMRNAALAQQQGYAAQVMGLREEIANIDIQVVVEKRLITMAQADLAQATQIATRGFISGRDLASREETLLSRQQRLAGLQQTKAAKASSIEQAERASREASANASGANAAIDTSRAQIERDRAVVRDDQGYSLVAPADGRVAALNINTGDAVNTRDSTMAIVPSSERLIARLYIPNKAAGFVRNGQSVRLALDAYPFERYGTVKSVINIVSSAPLMNKDKEGNSTPVYIATAAIKSPFVTAYGRQQALIPGMTFTARIVIEERSLIQWLFDPLFAAAQ